MTELDPKLTSRENTSMTDPFAGSPLEAAATLSVNSSVNSSVDIAVDEEGILLEEVVEVVKPKALHANGVIFEPKSKDLFSVEVTEAAASYFTTNKISSKGNMLLWVKTGFYLLGYIGLFLSLFFVDYSGLAALGVCALLGLFAAGIGFNVGHDALHGAFSESRSVNSLIGHSFTMMGANTHNWKMLHNHIHHNYTNIEGADGDLAPVSLLRFYPSQEGLKPWHRFQHFYAPFLYSLTSLVWVFKKDFDHINKESHMNYKKPSLPSGEFKRLLVFKSLYLITFLVLPMFFTPYGVMWVITGFLVAHFFQGLSLALVFQLGHLVEGPQIVKIPEEGPVSSWHRLQLIGTCNFAAQSRVAAWLFGGLNQQVEHHLFPHVSHVHYPALSKIVKQVAAKHGVPYHEHPTYLSALVSHFRILKSFGNPQDLSKTA